MPLEDLNEDLYDPSSQEQRKHQESQFDPEISAPTKISLESKKEQWEEVEKGLSQQQKKAIKLGAIILSSLIILLALVFVVLNFKAGAFSEDRVKLEVKGFEGVKSAELVEYKILVKNNNRAKLKNAELTINYSANFRPEGNINFNYEGESNSRIYIGEIDAHSTKEAIIRGRFYAPRDNILYLKPELSYVPSDFNSVFKSSNQLGVNVETSPVSLKISAPREILSGNDIEYVVEYKNLSSIDFKDLILKTEYSDGFNFQDADPYPLEKNNFWYIGDLKAQQEGKISIRGSMVGSRNDVKSINVDFGMSKGDGGMIIYNEKEEVTKITSSPIAISHKVNGASEFNADAGDLLKYNVDFKNEGEIGLRNSILSLHIDSSILDFSEINIGNQGYYDSSSKTITWKASSIPELANLEPGQIGSVYFTVPVKRIIEVNSELDKEFKIESVAKLESPDLKFYNLGTSQASSNKAVVKLNSKVIFEIKGYYNDANIANSGPLPPKVGEETTYTLHWLVTNVSNDLSGVEISSHLPTGVRWKGKTYPEYEDIEFNERTNEVKWNIGLVPNGAGVLDFPKEVSFQVGIIPEVNQVGKSAKLLEKSLFIGQDSFTGVEVKKELEGKDTTLTEDLGIGGGNYSITQ